MKNKKIEEVQELLIKLSELQSEYYNTRTILGFSLPGEITDEEFKILELKMPSLQKQIEKIKQDLENIFN